MGCLAIMAAHGTILTDKEDMDKVSDHYCSGDVCCLAFACHATHQQWNCTWNKRRIVGGMTCKEIGTRAGRNEQEFTKQQQHHYLYAKQQFGFFALNSKLISIIQKRKGVIFVNK
jgi:hypothetical protein